MATLQRRITELQIEPAKFVVEVLCVLKISLRHGVVVATSTTQLKLHRVASHPSEGGNAQDGPVARLFVMREEHNRAAEPRKLLS